MNAFEVAVKRFSGPELEESERMLVDETAPDLKVPVTEIEETPASEPVEPITEEERARFSAQWESTPLILMLPQNRRAEAEKILAEHPELRRLLHMCKLGVLDCWTVMERLGMDPFLNALSMR